MVEIHSTLADEDDSIMERMIHDIIRASPPNMCSYLDQEGKILSFFFMTGSFYLP